MIGTTLSMALAGLVGLWMLVLAAFIRPLRAVWREPVFRTPIAILESDDWGAGPLEQVPALVHLRGILAAARNAHGETAVMTIGVILETIDRDATRAAGRHVAEPLGSPAQREILQTLVDGERTGVFALQLHGRAHYWPDSLLARARHDAAVAVWLDEPGLGWTETLPSALQSRWTETTTLPSTPLTEPAVRAAVAAEVEAWRELFGTVPAVAVPTTFVWPPVLERALVAAGVGVMVTPGARHEARGADGAPACITAHIVNGGRGEGGLLFLVRDVYFEPALGHHASRLADGVLARAARGRPALIEMHRFNFCGPRATPTAFDTLRDALVELLARVPEVRFMSSAALASLIARNDAAFIERSFVRHLGMWARRVRELRGFGRCARLTGLTFPLQALGRLA